MKVNAWMIAGIAIVALLIFKPDILSGLNLGGAGADDDKVIVNPTPTSKAVVLSLKDKYNIATTPTDNVKYYKNGVLVSSAAVSGTSITADKGDVLTLYASENSTTYYTNKKEYTVGDALTQNLQLDVCAIDTAVSKYWTNEQGTASTNVTVGSGSTRAFKVHVEASAYKCIGNPQIEKSLGLVNKYNTTTWSTVDVSNAEECSGSYSGVVANAAGFSPICYQLDSLENTEAVDLTYTVTAINGVNPATSTSDIVITIIDKDYDFNAQTDAVISGFQDESSNNLGDSTTQSLTIGFL